MVKNLPATQETQVLSLGREDPLTKRTATHSSILAWRIPWTEKPVLFTGSQGQTPAEKYHFLFHCGGGRCMADGGDPRGARRCLLRCLHPADSLRGKPGLPGRPSHTARAPFILSSVSVSEPVEGKGDETI